MKLPAIFEQDIKSKNIQLIPLLIIERDETWGDFSLNSQSIFLSTHDISVQRTDEDSSGLPYLSEGQGSFDGGMYFSPLLLDNPVITEKIDVENRKYTISKCTFKVSNSVYNGSRFSDILTTDSLIGRKINFAYKSINSSFPVASQLLDPDYDNTWGDVYDTYEYVSPTFYFGEIRDVKHTNESVSIVAEDLSSTYLHQQLPKNSLPNNSSVKEQYRGAKIPMVYGYMPRSPLVVGASKKLYADSRPITGFYKNIVDTPERYAYPFNRGTGEEFDFSDFWEAVVSGTDLFELFASMDTGGDFGAVFTYIDDHYCNVSDYIYYRLADSTKPDSQETYFNFSGYDEDNIRQISYQNDDIYNTTIAKFESNPLLSRNVAQLMVVYKPGKIALERRNHYPPFDNDMDDADRISLGEGDNDWGDEGGVDANDLPVGGDQLTEEEFERMTDNDFSSEYLDAQNDLTLSNWSEAQISERFNADQLYYNRWKHSIFRFVIDTEPPITFLNRGGASLHEHYGGFNHWIAFGHWVMREQHNTYDFDSSSIYTSAKHGHDNSENAIKYRYIINRNDVQESLTHQVYRPNEVIFDSWGEATYLGDIIRFSDFHNSGTYGEYNPERIQWGEHEQLAKSPLEFFGAETVDETGDNYFGSSYTNPYAKFTNRSSDGRYIIELGVYGVQASGYLLNPANNLTGNYGNFSNPEGEISYNFTYRASMRGWLPETTCMSVCDTKMDFKDMYGSVIGRKDANSNIISHPADIIADIFVNELGYSENMLDQESLEESKQQHSHQDWHFSFTQRDEINSKELIEDIAKSTFMFPRIGFDGTLKFPQIKRKYTQDDLDKSILIEELDVIKYSYGLTKRQELRTGTELKYNYDHKTENYFGDVDSKNYQGISIINQTLVSEEHLNQDGLDNIEDNIKEFESKYMRSDDFSTASPDNSLYIKTMRDFEHMSTQHYRNRHLTIKIQLPLKYLNIEVGDYVRFDKLLDGVKAYGIDYTSLASNNNQYIYPLFLCTSIKKSIEYIELDCLQLHHLWFMDEDSEFWQPDEVWMAFEGEGEIEDDPSGGVEDEQEYSDDVLGTCAIPDIPATGQVGGVFENLTELECMELDQGGFWTAYEEGEEPEEEPEEYLEEEEPNHLTLPSQGYAEFSYGTFNLNQFSGFPYVLLSTGAEYLVITTNDHAFGGSTSGIWRLFSNARFKVQQPDSDDFVSVGNNYAEILPFSLTDLTTDENVGQIILEIVHYNTIDGFMYVYTLRNTSSVGQTVQVAWVLTIQETDDRYENMGTIIAAPFDDISNPGSQFYITNYSEYNIRYESPHDLNITTLGTPFSVSNDSPNFNDLVSISKSNKDKVNNPLDAIILVNQLLDND